MRKICVYYKGYRTIEKGAHTRGVQYLQIKRERSLGKKSSSSLGLHLMRTMAGGFIGWLKKRKIVALLLVFTFIVSGLIVNVLQLFTIPLYYLNKRWFRIVNAKVVYLHWCSKYAYSSIPCMCLLSWVELTKFVSNSYVFLLGHATI